MTNEVYLCDYVRTPIGRYGGELSSVRPDDLAAFAIKALCAKNPSVAGTIDEVVLGCANQAGEDNRNVARMAALLAGLPVDIPAITVNRLCASGLDAVIVAARAIRAGDMEVLIAGGVESMSRAPFVLAKAEDPFQRTAQFQDTTIGWRFINPVMAERFGVDTMPETAENVAAQFQISRQDQDAFAWRSQQRAGRALKEGVFFSEITGVSVAGRKSGRKLVDRDEHPRPDTTLEALGGLKPIVKSAGSVTVGNSSGVNDGAAALLLASPAAAARLGLRPMARITGCASAAVPPRIMGIGPVPAVTKLLERSGVEIGAIDVLEINEAFASQCLACLRQLGLPDDAEHVNPRGGAIALGHPLGASGARIVGSLALELQRSSLRSGIATMCVGVGQGVAIALERVAA